MVRQTDIAQTIDLALDKAKYDECAKKLLSYKSIIAWILKSCTKEFSQYSIAFIMDHCLKGKRKYPRGRCIRISPTERKGWTGILK